MISIIIYISTCCLTVVFAYLWDCFGRNTLNLSKCKSRIGEYSFMLLSFLPMYLVNASAYYTGGDYSEYVRYFHNIAKNKDTGVEFAYYWINKLVIFLGEDFQLVYFIVCFLGYGLLFLCIKKYSCNYAFSLLLYFGYTYFFRYGMNLIRQFVAIFLIVYAYSYIKDKKLIRYIIIVLLAATFHKSALVMLPFYFILNKKIKLSFYMLIVWICIPINFFFNQVLTWLFATFKPSYLSTNYVTRGFSWDIAFIACYAVVVALIILYYDKIYSDETTAMFANATFIGFIISTAACWLPEYKRIAYYFLTTVVFLIPKIFSYEKRKNVKLGILIILTLILFFHMSRALPYWKIYPYKSVFNVFNL